MPSNTRSMRYGLVPSMRRWLRRSISVSVGSASFSTNWHTWSSRGVKLRASESCCEVGFLAVAHRSETDIASTS